ncbi:MULTISPECIES: prolipoprotein diacylglyceryl transferase [Ensifer]|uniref:Phosphatidylglycerol--prolipoprotein diacylglyceryl transferase n=1 Tax=Ensifer canadensis TaxID=555315 RepID=A0AAW4FSU7_9HYPH|nr:MULTISPECIES: prolipoprotein diacylglyceryl transferase [Ensifer]AHK45041.1 prolipoprotein diacylglyceryl transferase [Ensifer adhaerens OV14]KQU85787.1 prolipoprotein diacylglyceryl transferase [Ensifer sp. Root31]KQW53948.1 prolipoprotein diacylglyceryl transferase [Ensifer sp. Root1252]KRC69124.1 prolipoprotein diacylglyceryl transferase [Ensifer sp. Root231]KRC95116.1 prolipoprotein diacylglyceryl transferase [Ensifer sp. Root258]
METIATRLAILPFPQIDPVIFQIGPLAVHWYGLAYVAGILIGWYYARRLVQNTSLWRNGEPAATLAQLDDFLLWAAGGIVLGGRIGYILFYDLGSVLENPIRALEIWNGGMSFHGGFLGTTIAMIVFARRNGIAIWSMFDIVATVVPIGLFFGRIANFINGELWGRLSSMPWAMVFPTGGPFARHPSQLYEAALEGLVLLTVIAWFIYRRHALKSPGLVTGIFVLGYAASRIFVEFFREPDAQIGYLAGGWLTMGMLLSLPMALAGIWAIARACRAAVAAA